MSKTADDFIGYGLRIIKGPQPLYLGLPATGKAPVKSFTVGQITPPIDSWVKINNKLYWTFAAPAGLSYYLEHKEPGVFQPIKYATTEAAQGQNAVTAPKGGGLFDGLQSILKAAPVIIGGLLLFNLTRR